MVFKRNQNIEYYSTLDTISVKRFDDVLKGDYKRLIKSPQNVNRLPGDIKTVWEALYTEYKERTREKDPLRIYLLQSELRKLRDRYGICMAILRNLRMGRPRKVAEELVEELRHWNIFIDLKKDHDKELDKAEKQLKNSQNRMSRLATELEDLLEKDDKETMSLNKLKMKVILSQKIDIDLEIMTMDEWLIMWDEIKEQADNVQRQINKVNGK